MDQKRFDELWDGFSKVFGSLLERRNAIVPTHNPLVGVLMMFAESAVCQEGLKSPICVQFEQDVVNQGNVLMSISCLVGFRVLWKKILRQPSFLSFLQSLYKSNKLQGQCLVCLLYSAKQPEVS